MSEVGLALIQRLCFNLTLYSFNFRVLSFMQKDRETKEPILRSQLDGWRDREPNGPLGLLVAFRISFISVLSTHSDPWPC